MLFSNVFCAANHLCRAGGGRQVHYRGKTVSLTRFWGFDSWFLSLRVTNTLPGSQDAKCQCQSNPFSTYRGSFKYAPFRIVIRHNDASSFPYEFGTPDYLLWSMYFVNFYEKESKNSRNPINSFRDSMSRRNKELYKRKK